MFYKILKRSLNFEIVLHIGQKRMSTRTPQNFEAVYIGRKEITTLSIHPVQENVNYFFPFVKGN